MREGVLHFSDGKMPCPDILPVSLPDLRKHIGPP